MYMLNILKLLRFLVLPLKQFALAARYDNNSASIPARWTKNF